MQKRDRLHAEMIGVYWYLFSKHDRATAGNSGNVFFVIVLIFSYYLDHRHVSRRKGWWVHFEWVCTTGPFLVLWRAFWHISTFSLRRLHIFLFLMEQVSWKPTTCSHRMELIYDYVETRDVVTRTECSREKESYDRTPRYTGYSHSVLLSMQRRKDPHNKAAYALTPLLCTLCSALSRNVVSGNRKQPIFPMPHAMS